MPTCVDEGILPARRLPRTQLEEAGRGDEARRSEKEISVRPHVSHAPRRRGSVFRSLVARSYLVLVSVYSHLRERADHAAGLCCFECQENGSLVLQRVGMRLCCIVPCASEAIGVQYADGYFTVFLKRISHFCCRGRACPIKIWTMHLRTEFFFGFSSFFFFPWCHAGYSGNAG